MRSDQPRTEAEEFLTPAEAATELGMTLPQLETLVKQYGIGRYHLPEPGRQIVFSRVDIERLKRRRG